jgi:hypothetical protein
MKHVNILVEGQTEETFIKELIAPYLFTFQITIVPIIISTKRIKEGGKFRGGLSNSNFDHFLNDLKRLIHSTPQGIVATFIDYYRLPSRFPGYEERLSKKTQLEKVLFLERKLTEHVGNPRNFIPYIQLHEFEAFHFSDKIGFSNYLAPEEANIHNLLSIVDSHNNPEEINEGPETSPSKRILCNYASYDKVIDGNLILMEIGVERLLEKCQHFRSFVEKLKTLE